MIGTRFNLIDLSEIKEEVTVVTPDNAPLYLACGPTAKGTERMSEWSGSDFSKMFGGPDFKKYGQISVQTQGVIDAGAKVLFKRVVASDATLANITLLSDIKVIPRLRNLYDANGKPVYETEAVETTVTEPVDTFYIGETETGYSADKDTLITNLAQIIVDKYGMGCYTNSENVVADLEEAEIGEDDSVTTTVRTWKVTVLKDETKTVQQAVTVTTANGATVKKVQQIWAPSAELGYVAVTDTDVQTLNTRDAANNLEDKYKNQIGMIPTDDDITAVADENHVVFIPTLDNISEEVYVALCTLWGYDIDEINDVDYMGYWIVDNKWITPEGKLTIPSDVTDAAVAHEAIEMHYRYPLFTIADIGRGVSTKSFTITPENDISKNLGFMYYTLSILEDGAELESIRFSMMPDVIYRGQCVDLEMASKNELKFSNCASYEDNVNAFIEKLAACMNEDVTVLQQNDFIFGTTRKGAKLSGVSISSEFGADMATQGIMLESGDNGSFGDAPMLIAPELVNEKILAFYSDGRNENFELDSCPKDENGTYVYKTRLNMFDTTDDIYDLDTYQLDAVFDANYPAPIKGAIGYLINWRSDGSYFRDHGLGCRSFTDAEAMVSGEYYNTIATDMECAEDGTEEGHDVYDLTSSIHRDINGNGLIDDGNVTTGYDLSKNITDYKSIFISDWVQSYDVINPYDLKEINVTITYDLSKYMVGHILNRVNYPFAGERNGAVLNSIVKDTLSYKPRTMPGVTEKDDLEDIKCNYASYYKEKFVVESLWTSQTKYSQLSFINNVMAVQKVIKALRVKFPSIRYQFITSPDDLAAYTTEINEFLSLYSGMFAELRFEYVEDKVAAANKIYRAALYFRCNNFTQGEKIDAYMLPTEAF